MTRLLISILVVLTLIFTLVACTNSEESGERAESSESGEQSGQSESGEQSGGEEPVSDEGGEESGEPAESSESGEQSGQSESGEQSSGEEPVSDEGGEESVTQYGLTDTYDVVRSGARLIVSYDDSWNTFRGTVENTTTETLTSVRVEIHLSNDVELGPSTPVDLAPGQMAEITLPATKQRFETWSAHPEVGGGAEQTDEAAPTEIEAAARDLLANAINADEDDFTLVSSESVSWPDASLGCPQEGFGYADVVTPGYKLVFALGDTSYAVHTNADGFSLILCNDG